MRKTVIAMMLTLGTTACGQPIGQPVCTMPMPMSIAGTNADCDRDGFFSYDESLAYGAVTQDGTVRPYTRAEFDAVDRDRDGKLDISEFQALLMTTSCWAVAGRACPAPTPSGLAK